jgi:hypothetical protein
MMDEREFDMFVMAMFFLWASRPRDPNPQPDGSYFIGEVGDAREKTWERLTPYSPAVKISGIKFRNETPYLAFVNDLDEPGYQPDFW